MNSKIQVILSLFDHVRRCTHVNEVEVDGATTAISNKKKRTKNCVAKTSFRALLHEVKNFV